VKTTLLSYCFPPHRYPRAIQIAHLARHSSLDGLEVVAAHQEGTGDEGLLSTVPASLPVHRLPWRGRAALERGIRDHTLKDRAFAPDPFAPWARAAARWLISADGLSPSDVLVSFGQPMSDHLAALAVARRSRTRWIAHFSDPWVDNPFRHASRAVRRLNLFHESRVVRGADRLVFTSDEIRQLVMRKYASGLAEKATVLPHAFDADLYPASPEASADRIVLRYVGNFYGHRGPEPLYRGVARLLETEAAALDDVRIEFIGVFEQDPLQTQTAPRMPAGLVSAGPPLPYLQALAAMASADVLLVLDAPAARSVFLPSKLVEYLGARRPILAITPPGPAADLVAETGGFVADPAHPDIVAAALRRAILAAREPGRGPWGRPDVIDRFAATAVARQFDELVRGVAIT
jgi:glycosyltransferase involved in cell wall biosynthesis